MTRRKPYRPKSFESSGRSGDTSANIYESMLLSPAFMDLTPKQRLLYVYMKAQYYGKKKPGKVHPEVKSLQREDLFYFPLSIAEKYKLYTRANKRQFYNDIKVIESHGFIKTVSSGKSTKSRSIYQFVNDWIKWEHSAVSL